MIRLRVNLLSVDPGRKIRQQQERLNKRKDVIAKAEEKRRNRQLLVK